MGRVKQGKGRRDGGGGDRNERQPGLHWVPLRHQCGCVADWGFNSSATPPPGIMEWCMAMLNAPCIWHGGDGGVSVPLDQETVRFENSPLGSLLTQQVSDDRRKALGNSLSNQAQWLKEATKDSPQGILVEVPEKYQRVMRSKGFDPAETWLQMRMLDIWMNLGRPTLTPEMIEMLPEPRS